MYILNFFKKIAILSFIAVFIACSPSFALSAKAAVLPAFGGLAVFEVPCTCSANLWIWYAPLYLNSPIPVAGALVYEPGSIAYLYYIPHPGSYSLGTYFPGVQTCWMYAGYFCFPLPSYGLIAPLTGTSP